MKRKQTKQNNSHRKKKLKSRLEASPTQTTAVHVNAKSCHTRLFLISEQAEVEVISEAVTPISEEPNQSTTEETTQPFEEEPDRSEEQIYAEHQLPEEPNSSSEDDSSPEHISSPEDYVSSESSSTTISSPEDGSSNGSNSSEKTHLFEKADSPTALIESDEEFTGEDLNRVEGTEIIEEITEDITPVAETETTESEEIATGDDTHHVEETENVESKEATTGEDSNRIEEETHNTEENSEPEGGDTRQEEAVTQDGIHTPEETHSISQEETNYNSGTEQVSAAPEEEEAETSGELERLNQQPDPPEPSTSQTDIFPLPLVATPATELSSDIFMDAIRAFEHTVATAIAQLSDNLGAISRQVTSEFNSFEIALAPPPPPPPPQILTNGLLTEAEALINRQLFDEIQDNEEDHALELGQRQTRVEVPFHHDPPSLGYMITPRTRIPRVTNGLANGTRHLANITLDTLPLPSNYHSTSIGVEESEDSSDQSDLPTP